MLEAIGLGPQDEEVYDALVRRTQATVTEIVHDCHLPASAARRTLQSLVELGLATRSTGRPVRYIAVSPDSSLEAISGRDEVNHRWVQLQQDTRVQMRGFDRPPYADPQEHTESNPIELNLLKRGVKYRVVYDTSVLELPGWAEDVTAGMRHGEQARIAADLPMKLAISDDRLAIIPLPRAGDSVVAASYLIHASPLLDALVALLEAVWERSVPVRLTGSGAESAPEGGELSREEERLLTLLASGATDKAAGRALGWSERTVQRHITKLMRRLGARTRFQVAMEATRRGWI
ncbi:helix-turn-helix transcriptional regulator [Nonomuraea sp. 10N515B]|uniref:helix-turn-helix transcriptional regulator n=1 Tax=Nonomuraea sp. 10N515B TaxID=3457422 RepID=UPI003FCED2DB